MFLLREQPDEECFRRLLARYPEMDCEGVRVLMKLVRTASDVSECFERFLTKYGLSSGRFAILMYLNRNPETPVNQTHLAEAYGVTKATVTGLIDGLERDTMVERLPDLNDRRATLVRLAPAGREFLEAFLPDHFRGVAKVTAGLDAAERARLMELIDRLHSGIAQLGGAGCGASQKRSVPAPSTGDSTGTTVEPT